jgi:hypothetical protein
MERAAWRQLARCKRRELGLHHAALVVALLRPGIGKKEMDCGERAVWDHVLEHVQGVVTNDFHVRQTCRGDAVEKASYTGAVHLDREKVRIRSRLGDLQRRFAHAGADFQDERRDPTENLGRFYRLFGKGESVLRKEFFESPLLRRGGPALAQDIAADRPVQAALDEIVPSVGELGAAV